MTIEEMKNKYREQLIKDGIYSYKVIELMVEAYGKGCLDFFNLLNLIENKDKEEA